MALTSLVVYLKELAGPELADLEGPLVGIDFDLLSQLLLGLDICDQVEEEVGRNGVEDEVEELPVDSLSHIPLVRNVAGELWMLDGLRPDLEDAVLWGVRNVGCKALLLEDALLGALDDVLEEPQGQVAVFRQLHFLQAKG